MYLQVGLYPPTAIQPAGRTLQSACSDQVYRTSCTDTVVLGPA
jgi:hypothetical protein